MDAEARSADLIRRRGSPRVPRAWFGLALAVRQCAAFRPGELFVCVTGIEPYLGPSKTWGSGRTVELPEVAATALARHIELFPPPETQIWDRTHPDQRKHHKRATRLLFVTIPGKPIHRETWASAARQAQIPPGTGPHCLRHYLATLPHGAGVKRVQLELGHSTPLITSGRSWTPRSAVCPLCALASIPSGKDASQRPARGTFQR